MSYLCTPCFFSVGHFTSIFGFLTIACIGIPPIFGFVMDFYRRKFNGKNFCFHLRNKTNQNKMIKTTYPLKTPNIIFLPIVFLSCLQENNEISNGIFLTHDLDFDLWHIDLLTLSRYNSFCPPCLNSCQWFQSLPRCRNCDLKKLSQISNPVVHCQNRSLHALYYITLADIIICVRHYAGRKILDVSVAQPKTCHHKAGKGICRALEGGTGG